MKNRKTPMRRCIGCMESKPKRELVRIACYEGRLKVDPTGKAMGRGVYLCPNPGCIERARKRNALNRSLQTDFSREQIESLYRELEEHAKAGGSLQGD